MCINYTTDISATESCGLVLLHPSFTLFCFINCLLHTHTCQSATTHNLFKLLSAASHTIITLLPSIIMLDRNFYIQIHNRKRVCLLYCPNTCLSLFVYQVSFQQFHWLHNLIFSLISWNINHKTHLIFFHS